jgi:hypothetical protein
LWQYLISSGDNIVRAYFDALLSAPRSQIVEFIVDVLTEFLISFPVEANKVWFTNSMQRVANDVLTMEERSNMLGKFFK